MVPADLLSTFAGGNRGCARPPSTALDSWARAAWADAVPNEVLGGRNLVKNGQQGFMVANGSKISQLIVIYRCD